MSKRIGSVAGAALAVAVGLVAPARLGLTDDSNVATSSRSRGPVFERTELYFGSQRPDAPPVTEEEFDRFVDDYVTPRFPDGLTQLVGEGQFTGASGEAIEEQSFVLVLLYPRDDREADAEIEQIRTEYKTQFGQESVLRADSRDRVSF